MRALALIVALAASPALAFAPQIQMRVAPGPDGDFTVAYAAQARLTDYWCAAGTYVTQRLGLPDGTRVYRLSPPPREAGRGIAFTLDGTRSAGDTGLTTFGGRQDGSFSAGVAVAQFCRLFDEPF